MSRVGSVARFARRPLVLALLLVLLQGVLAWGCSRSCERRRACCQALPANLEDPVRGLVCWTTSRTETECARDLAALAGRMGGAPVPSACRP
jgi:hypothetical protein